MDSPARIASTSSKAISMPTQLKKLTITCVGIVVSPNANTTASTVPNPLS